MNQHGISRRTVSWPAVVMAAALGLVLLSWLPVWAQQGPAAEKPATADYFYRAEAPATANYYYRLAAPLKGTPDVAALEAQLKQLEADLKQKLADIEKAKATLQAAREAKSRDNTPAGAGKGPVVIRIEISSGEGPVEGILKEFLQKLEKELPGKGKVLLMRTADPRVIGVRAITGQPYGYAPVVPPAPGGLPAWPVPGMGLPALPVPGMGVPALPGVGLPMGGVGVNPADLRMMDLEKKLDKLLKELESLHREMKEKPALKR
jgi:hypothetical protein